MLNEYDNYLGLDSSFLDNAASNISGDYQYNFYPSRSSSFGYQYEIPKDFQYSFFPYPSPEAVESMFGKKKRKRRASRKFIGYIVRKNGRIVKVYRKNSKNVLSNGKVTVAKKIYKTKAKAVASKSK